MIHEKETKKKDAKHEIGEAVKEKEILVQDYLDKLKRVQADFENYVKQTEKQKQEFIKYANKDLIIKLLGITDNLKHALNTINKTKTEDETVKGMMLIFNQLQKILDEEGLKPIESVGKKYDPYFHEIIKQVETNEENKEDGTILEEIQTGYFLHDIVLRPSKVIVSTGGKKNE